MLQITYKIANTHENFLSGPNSFVNVSYKILTDNYGREGLEDGRKGRKQEREESNAVEVSRFSLA